MLATERPFLETMKWLGGFALIEAAGMAKVIALARDSAVIEFASVEIRRTLEQSHCQTGAGRPGLQI